MVSHRKPLLLAVAFFSVIVVLAANAGRILYAVRVARGNLTETETYYSVTLAPPTFAAWQQRYSFPQRSSGETLDAYRHRVNIVVYYNLNELGLGREVGCSIFQDTGPSGLVQTGLACFVNNYGERFTDPTSAIADAINGANLKNTVAITYAPSSTAAPPSLGTLPQLSYATQFAAFDSNGNLASSSNLDFSGIRPVPQICANCHGGTYDSTDHLMIGGQFTPINTSILKFATVPGYTQADQAAAMAALNAMMATIPQGGGGCPRGETLVCSGGICRCSPS